jgi:simple sugar transport system ATP-binding protein
VRAGECVGLVGLQGSGATTAADAIVGLLKARSGSISVRGDVGYVPQDRHQRGFAPQLGVDENLTHAVLDRISSRLGIVSFRRRSEIAQLQVKRLQIVARALDQPVSSLSGGNQQKVVVGRALASEPSVLVAINPTVGVDVASKEALLDAIAAVRDQGVAVLLVSDDFDDLRVCTRLLVMVRGRITARFDRAPWGRQRLIGAVEGLELAG